MIEQVQRWACSFSEHRSGREQHSATEDTRESIGVQQPSSSLFFYYSSLTRFLLSPFSRSSLDPDVKKAFLILCE